MPTARPTPETTLRRGSLDPGERLNVIATHLRLPVGSPLHAEGSWKPLHLPADASLSTKTRKPHGILTLFRGSPGGAVSSFGSDSLSPRTNSGGVLVLVLKKFML